ncbi:Tap42 interacting protein [Sorochytrium milnesiophthora]
MSTTPAPPPPVRKQLRHHAWLFASIKAPISNAQEIDADLDALARRAAPKQPLHVLPEMYFGNNCVDVSFSDSAFRLNFNALDALQHVQVGRDAERWKSVKVAAASTWQKKIDEQRNTRKQPPQAATASPSSPSTFDILPEDIGETSKPYDWTFATTYMGTALLGSQPLADDSIAMDHQDAVIPLDKLREPEPILFYDDVLLYEDELADNGVAHLSVKIRVMPSGFFILQRLFCRVDGVLFTINDTRVYHSFDTKYIVREYASRSEDYAVVREVAVQQRLRDLGVGGGGIMGGGAGAVVSRGPGRPEPAVDVSPLLLDANWVYQVMCGPPHAPRPPDETKRELIHLP